jgi:hypothetical protein
MAAFHPWPTDMKSSGAARRDNDSRRRPMDICDPMPAKRSPSPAGLAFGRGERGLFSLMPPVRTHDGPPEPALAVLAANASDCGPFRAALKVYGPLFLAIIVINTILYGWRLAALTPLLIFIICPDGTSNKAMYLPLRGRLLAIFADRLANRSFLQPRAASACPHARSVPGHLADAMTAATALQPILILAKGRATG